MKRLAFVILFMTSILAVAKQESISWKVCEKELKEFCTTVTEDDEKHECLEEAPKGKISSLCEEFNHGLEKSFQINMIKKNILIKILCLYKFNNKL